MVPSFVPGPRYPIGHNPLYPPVVADFNGDGIPDIAVANQTDQTVSVLFGQGDGTFQAPRTYRVGGAGCNPGAIAVGDFNHDNFPDLAVVCSGTDEVAILLNNGDGTFPTSVTYYTGGPNPFGIAVGDFDGDGNVDLVVSNLGPKVNNHYIGNNIGVLRGRGDGTFEPARVFRVGQGAAGVAVADFNGDGRDDIAVANYESDSVGVLLNVGGGSAGNILFDPMASYRVTSGDGPAVLEAADFNGDGYPDLVVSNRKGSTINLFQDDSQGTMHSAGTILERSLGGGFPAVADFNQDGNLDFAETRPGLNNFGLYIGNGDVTFITPPQDTSTGPASAPAGLAAADLNGDNWPDLIVSGGGTNGYVAVYLNDQNWSPGPNPDASVSPTAAPAGVRDPGLAMAAMGLAHEAAPVVWVTQPLRPPTLSDHRLDRLAVDRLFAAKSEPPRLLLGVQPGRAPFSRGGIGGVEDNSTLELPMDRVIVDGFFSG